MGHIRVQSTAHTWRYSAAYTAQYVLLCVTIEKHDGEKRVMMVSGTKALLIGATVCSLGSSGLGVQLSHGLRDSFVAGSVPVGKTPQALAVDSRTERVFVANGDSKGSYRNKVVKCIHIP